MRSVSYSGQFKKDVKLAQKRGKDMQLFVWVMQLLIEDNPLPASLQDHPLRGNLKPFRNLHVQPNWLLIYYVTDDEHVHFDRTGTHADIFDK